MKARPPNSFDCITFAKKFLLCEASPRCLGDRPRQSSQGLRLPYRVSVLLEVPKVPLSYVREELSCQRGSSMATASEATQTGTRATTPNQSACNAHHLIRFMLELPFSPDRRQHNTDPHNTAVSES